MTQTVQVGDTFMVGEVLEIKNAKKVLLARYLPEYPYKVTPRNILEITAWVESGKATIGGATPKPSIGSETKPGVNVAASKSHVRGAVKIGTKQAKGKTAAQAAK